MANQKKKNKTGWLGYTLVGIRDALVGYIGYYLKDGITTHGTDVYKSNSQNAQPIVSHITQYLDTSLIGYTIMGIAAADFAYQAWKTYKLNKIDDGQSNLESKIKKIKDGLSATKNYVEAQFKGIKTEINEIYSNGTNKIIGEIGGTNSKLDTNTELINNYIKATNANLEKNGREIKGDIDRINSGLEGVVFKLSEKIPENKRKEVIEKNGGEE